MIGVCLGRFFVRIASVVGFVESAAFEDDACAGADESFEFAFAAFRAFAFD